MALYVRADCHPDRAAAVWLLRCDRCRTEATGTLPGYPTDAACRKAAGAGWARVQRPGPSGKLAGADLCAACAPAAPAAVRAAPPRGAVGRRATARRTPGTGR